VNETLHPPSMARIQTQFDVSSMTRARWLALVAAVVVGGNHHRRWIRQQLGVESRGQPVTEADLRILQRAGALLKDPASWNRHYDRAEDGTRDRQTG